MLQGERIDAPLMIVKGDGSLMRAEVALEYPVETILSGPAASVVGAGFLTGLEDFLVSDMGGGAYEVTDVIASMSGKWDLDVMLPGADRATLTITVTN